MTDKLDEFNRVMQMVGEQHTYVEVQGDVPTLFLYEGYQLEELRIPDGVIEVRREHIVEESYNLHYAVSKLISWGGTSNLSKVYIPDSVEWLDQACFTQMGITEVTGGKGVKHIGDACFGDCERLKSVEFENAVFIQDKAFTGCKGIERMTLGKCTYTEGMPFLGCEKLDNIHGKVLMYSYSGRNNKALDTAKNIIRYSSLWDDLQYISYEQYKMWNTAIRNSEYSVREMREELNRLKQAGLIV